MQRESIIPQPTIDLGKASTVTQGPIGDMIEVSGLIRRTPFDGA